VSIPRILLATLLTIVPAASAQPMTEWITGQTGRGTARWTQRNAGLTYQGGAAFGWAVLKGTSVRNGWVETQFRPVDGRQYRAGGVIWRWLDADNYYVARGNALEDNVVAYKMEKGRRTDLTPVGAAAGTYGVKVPVAAGAWRTLRVEIDGPEFAVIYDGRRLFSVRDETFPGPGAVGVWSKADSVTEFQTFNYEAKS
jgi:hypothetical protein